PRHLRRLHPCRDYHALAPGRRCAARARACPPRGVGPRRAAGGVRRGASASGVPRSFFIVPAATPGSLQRLLHPVSTFLALVSEHRIPALVLVEARPTHWRPALRALLFAIPSVLQATGPSGRPSLFRSVSTAGATPSSPPHITCYGLGAMLFG